jgi:hypothetical protein
MYYISEVLSPTKKWYPHYQKLTYGIVLTARKLRHYFQEHSIVVVSEAPLSNILNNTEATGRVAQWGIELSPCGITYERRKAIKSQVLPNFIAEWTEIQTPGPPDMSSSWTMYFDGSKQAQGAGEVLYSCSPKAIACKTSCSSTFQRPPTTKPSTKP